MLWQEAVDAYLREGAWRDRTRALKRDLLGRRLGTWGGLAGKAVEAVTRDDVGRYLGKAREAGYAVGTIRSEYEALKVLLNWCVNAGLVPTNVALGIRVPKAKPRKDVLPPAASAIADRIREVVKDPRVRDALLLALWTGLRGRTVRALEWRWIRPWGEHQALEVPAAAMKTDEDFWVPLSPEAEAMLEARGREVPLREGRIFPGLRYREMWNWWGRVTKGSIFERMRLHDLRKAFATYTCRRGVPLDVAMRLTGHRSPKTLLQVYREVSREEAMAAVWKEA